VDENGWSNVWKRLHAGFCYQLTIWIELLTDKQTSYRGKLRL